MPAPSPISWANDDAWTPPIRAIIIRIRPIIVGIGVVARPARYGRRLRRRFLIHVKINALWDWVGMGPTATRPIGPNLGILIRGKRGSLNHIIIVAEIVKGPVA